MSCGITTGVGGAISTSGAGLGKAKPRREAKAEENSTVFAAVGWLSVPKNRKKNVFVKY